MKTAAETKTIHLVIEDEESKLYSLAEFFSLQTNTLIRELYSLYSNEKKSGLVEARKFRKFIRILNLIQRPQSRDIIGFLIKNGATTSQELETKTGLPQGTISRNLRALKSLGVVKISKVKEPYKSSRDRGPKVKVYTLSDANPKAAGEAQDRYAQIIGKQIEDFGRQSELDEWGDPANRKALYAEAKKDGLTADRFTDIYAFVDRTDIPDEEKPKAKKWLRDKLIDEAHATRPRA